MIFDYMLFCEKIFILLLIFKILNVKIEFSLKEGVICDFGKVLYY